MYTYNFSYSNSDKCPGKATKSSQIKTTVMAKIYGENHGDQYIREYLPFPPTTPMINLTFECSHHSQITNIGSCFCKKYQIYHTYLFDEQVSSNIKALLGTYEQLESSTFKQKDKNMYLFRIHPNDRIWNIGLGLTIDNAPMARIDFQSYDANWCPNSDYNGLNWEIFDPTIQRWSDNANIKVECIECPKNYFLCPTSGDCVPHCNGVKDCLNGLDEIKCYECQNSFLCPSNGECIPQQQHCDGKPDCNDGYDELFQCSLCQSEDKFQCQSDGKCIANYQHCNGFADCKDGYDEITDCKLCEDLDLFQCPSNGECISKLLHCDGHPDCEDGYDEKDNCTKCQDQNMLQCPLDGKCYSHNQHCDGNPDCIDGYDEKTNCSRCQDLDMYQCLSDGKCFSQEQHCDGKPDCEDGFDEMFLCTKCQDNGGFQCISNGECISKNQHCDGISDCKHGYDEIFDCTTCPSMTTTMSPTTMGGTTAGGSCVGNTAWISDSACDDVNNNEGCQWDGGDCCGDNVDTTYCQVCACLDPGPGGSGTGRTLGFQKWYSRIFLRCQK